MASKKTMNAKGQPRANVGVPWHGAICGDVDEIGLMTRQGKRKLLASVVVVPSHKTKKKAKRKS
jgi:hypothetical protein